MTAFANLYEMYYATAWNRRLSARNDARANVFADQVEAAFKRDADLTAQYHALNGGKWDGMMNQVHMELRDLERPDPADHAQRHPRGGRHPARQAGGQGRLHPLQAPAIPTSSRWRPPSSTTRSAARAWPGPSCRTWATATRCWPCQQGRPLERALRTACDLEYGVQIPRSGPATVRLSLAPTLDATGGDGIRIGVSIDNGPVQTVISNLIPTPGAASRQEQVAWVEAVKNHVHTVEARFPDLSAGRHVVKVWRLDDNAVLEKVTVALQ
ncbi:hypothetical protein ACRAWD_01285 [Caulobacter segnis]